MHRLASRLRDAGLRKGDRVAFLVPNIPALLEAHFAVPAAGSVLVPINTRLTADEVVHIVRHSGARMLFVDAELEHLVQSVDRARVEVVRIDDTGRPAIRTRTAWQRVHLRQTLGDIVIRATRS